jgi:hypothetical protein
MDLSRTERKLAAILLDMAADEFGNHGCNDFKALAHGLTPGEVQEIHTLLEQWDPEHEVRTDDYFMDCILMGYLAARMRAEKSTSDQECQHEDHEPEDCVWEPVGDDGERFVHTSGAEIWLTDADDQGRRWRYKTTSGAVSNGLFSYEQARDLATLFLK